MKQHSAIETIVQQSIVDRHREETGNPEAEPAIDFELILQIVSTLFGSISNCPFGGAARAIKAGSVDAKVAAYRAVIASGYTGSKAKLAMQIVENAGKAEDAKVEETIGFAMNLRGALALLLCLIMTTAAAAGPFGNIETNQAAGRDPGGPFTSAIDSIEGLSPDAQRTPIDDVDRILAMIDEVVPLTSEVTIAEYGCGRDARYLVRAALDYGCHGIGIEIDPEAADIARRYVAARGLSEYIEIVTGDALTVSVTADVGVAYLWPDLLEALSDQLTALDAFATWSHPVPGLTMDESAGVFLWPATPVDPPAQDPVTVSTNWGRWCSSTNCHMCNRLEARARGVTCVNGFCYQ